MTGAPAGPRRGPPLPSSHAAPAAADATGAWGRLATRHLGGLQMRAPARPRAAPETQTESSG
eukprot:11219126-Lingulodinium_polyedra.AAC.1